MKLLLIIGLGLLVWSCNDAQPDVRERVPFDFGKAESDTSIIKSDTSAAIAKK